MTPALLFVPLFALIAVVAVVQLVRERRAARRAPTLPVWEPPSWLNSVGIIESTHLPANTAIVLSREAIEQLRDSWPPPEKAEEWNAAWRRRFDPESFRDNLHDVDRPWTVNPYVPLGEDFSRLGPILRPTDFVKLTGIGE